MASSYPSANSADEKRVPIYSATSWASIMSLKAAFWLDPLRDIYEVRDVSPKT